MELVVMAAGMGSRFGGLKQIEPVGPNGEFIIDYSIYDAIRNGFDKVVFIIKEENYADFKETIGKRIEDKIKVEYAFQDMKDIPEGITIPADRTKPLGTGHALYCTRNIVKDSFAVISADDFYGSHAFQVLGESLKNTEDYIVIGYEIGNTITDVGAVKRGVCFMEDGKLKSIVESKVEKKDGTIVGEPIDGRPSYTMDEEQPVSMLLFGIRPDIYDYLEDDMVRYFNASKNLETDEYLLPSILDKMISEGRDIKVIPTISKWKGVTYKEDLEELKQFIRDAIDKGEYPYDLWK